MGVPVNSNGDQLSGKEKEQFDVQIEEGVLQAHPRKRFRTHQRSPSLYYYLGFVGQIGFTIAIPIAGGAIIGRQLDQAWSTYPRWTLALLLTGVVVSVFAFFTTIRELLKKR